MSIMRMDELLADAPTVMTVRCVADLLGVHRRTVNKWILHGEMPATRVGGAWRITRDDLLEWLQARHN